MRSAISSQLPDVEGMLVAFDTEASGLFVDEGARVSVVTLAWGDPAQPETRCFPFDHGALDKPGCQGVQAGFFDEAPNLNISEWDELCDWLNRQFLTAHNIKYDLQIMRAGHRKWGHGVDLSRRVVWCTLVTSPIVFPRQPTGLKPTSERLWGVKERETERKLQQWLRKHKDSRGNPRYDLAPWDLVSPYATKDAELGLRLYHHQQSMISEGLVAEPYELLDREVDLALCLYRMECRGVGFDVEGCRHAAVKLQEQRDALRRALALKWKRDPTPAAARWWFFTEQGAEPTSLTDGKQPSVDQDAISALVGLGIEDAAEYQQLAAFDSALTKWYGAWPGMCGPDGRLRPNYHQVKAEGVQGKGRGTISGRLSVERVQLQAIPHDFRLPPGVEPIRRFFRAKPGFDLWELDISQADVRAATHIARCEPMRQVFLSGGDVHGQVAQRVFGVSPDQADWDMWRTLAKRLTFAIIYGAGPKTFQKTLREQAGIAVPYSQAREWLDEYHATFPEFRVLYRKQEGIARSKGYVLLITGRRRWFSEFEQQFHPYKAMNSVIQGGVAEAMKIVKIETEYHYPGCLLNEIHDSLMLELPTGEEGATTAKLIAALMEEHLHELFGGWDADHPIPWKVDAKPWK